MNLKTLFKKVLKTFELSKLKPLLNKKLNVIILIEETSRGKRKKRCSDGGNQEHFYEKPTNKTYKATIC